MHSPYVQRNQKSWRVCTFEASGNTHDTEDKDDLFTPLCVKISVFQYTVLAFWSFNPHFATQVFKRRAYNVQITALIFISLLCLVNGRPVSIWHFLGQTSQLDNLPSEIPNLVIENARIRNYSLSILVMMPCPYCMCMVFYVKTVHGHSLLPGMLTSLVEVLSTCKKDTSRFMLCIWV
jgi:hypothetical protein